MSHHDEKRDAKRDTRAEAAATGQSTGVAFGESAPVIAASAETEVKQQPTTRNPASHGEFTPADDATNKEDDHATK